MKIFVSIASFCDPETGLTVMDAIEQAEYPDRISFGVLSQVLDGQDGDYLAPALPQVRQKIVSADQSKGVCWARHVILTELLQEEDFVLQIDSHTRFAPGWDRRFIEMWQATQNPRAILSCHPAPYIFPRELQDAHLPVFCAPVFDDDGVCQPRSMAISRESWTATPAPSFFIGAGCIFAPARAFRDVPYDPHLYFHGEEIAMAVRFFAGGWDLYTPSEVLVFHNYARDTGRIKHWERDGAWLQRQAWSVARLRFLLCGEAPSDVVAGLALQDVERYTPGSARSVACYERSSGVCFKTRTVMPWMTKEAAHATNRVPPSISYRFSLT